MWEGDEACKSIGVAIEHVREGEARLSMSVTEKMLGPDGFCSRGYVFTIADSAMAYASCTDGRKPFAQICDIMFDHDAVLGARLTATAKARHKTGRKTVFDVRVQADNGSVIAEFRGQTLSLGDPRGDPPATD